MRSWSWFPYTNRNQNRNSGAAMRYRPRFEAVGDAVTAITARKPTPSGLSLTHKFTKFQTDVSDAVDPNLYSEDRCEE